MFLTTRSMSRIVAALPTGSSPSMFTACAIWLRFVAMPRELAAHPKQVGERGAQLGRRLAALRQRRLDEQPRDRDLAVGHQQQPRLFLGADAHDVRPRPPAGDVLAPLALELLLGARGLAHGCFGVVGCLKA